MLGAHVCSTGTGTLQKNFKLLLWNLHAGAVLSIFGLSVIVFECSRQAVELGDC